MELSPRVKEDLTGGQLRASAAPPIACGGNVGDINHTALEELGGSGISQESLGKQERDAVEGVRQGLRTQGLQGWRPQNPPQGLLLRPRP